MVLRNVLEIFMIRIANSIVKSPNAIHMRDSISVILFPRFQVSFPKDLVHYIFSLLTTFLEVRARKASFNGKLYLVKHL